MATAPERLRLPTQVTPERYQLTIAPDLDEARFVGEADIAVVVHERTDRIVVNAAELTISAAWFERDGDRSPTAVEMDEDAEQATFTLDRAVDTGPATLHVEFAGILNDKLRGFYRSTFEHDGATRTLAVTQFEATDARRAFPCWDEPAHKAVFGVRLRVAPDLLAVSNGPELSRVELPDGRVEVTFADTMPMSTYLVAFVVGPLEASETVDVDGVPLRIVHCPGRGDLASFALDVGAFALRWFADYYGIVYPGDKMDMVAVPDFAFGAMENLGCVTYRESLLLIDPDTATQAELQSVVDVIAHELAHMWFGDLVTMSWWNGIWLNEAFATFMEMKCTAAYRPEWERWMHFGRERTTAFDTDALVATRAIEFPVHSPEDAEGMFDVLTYQKGSAVVRMLEQFLGEDPFRAGIRRYLQTHQFANTETGDLWDALEAETGEPVRAMMDSWIFQGGFPLVEVARVDSSTVRVRQQTFRYDGSDSDARWHVPVVVRAASEERIVLDGEQTTVDVGDGPVIANAGGHGFYRVRYAGALHDALVGSLGTLGSLERYAVLDDAHALCLRGDVDGASLAGLVAGLVDTGESDLAVWQLAADALDTLDRVVPAGDQDAWSAWLRSHLQPLWDRLGPEVAPGDDDRRRALRGVVLGILGNADEPDLVELSQTLFEKASADPASVDPGLASGALRVAASHADAEVFERILDRFRHGETPQEQFRHLYALARARDLQLFERYLDLLWTDEIRSQNLAFAGRAALWNSRHGATAWAAVRDHWELLVDRLPFNSTRRLTEGITTQNDRVVADEIERFFANHPLPNAEKAVAQQIERMRVSVALAGRESGRLVADLP